MVSPVQGNAGALPGTPPSTPHVPPLPKPSAIQSPVPGRMAGLDPEKQRADFSTRLESWMKSKFLDLRTAYTVFHQLGWQNILFYADQLWITWDNARRIWAPAVAEDDWTPMPVINEFAPAIDSVTSIFQIPEVEAVPKQENNMEAHEVAEVANVLSESFLHDNGLIGTIDNKESKGEIASQLFVLLGNVFTIVRKKKAGTRNNPIIESVPMLEVRCPNCDASTKISPDDPRVQQLMADPMCPQCGGPISTSPTVDTRAKIDPLTGAPVVDTVTIWNTECKVGNPLFGLPRSGAKSTEDMRFIFWAERMTLDEIYEEWQYEAQPDNQFLDSMESSWEIALNFYFTGYSNLTQSTKEAALVVIVFVEPNKVKEVPEGGVAVMVNEKIIHYESWDEACPVGHQLAMGGYLKMPTTFFFRSTAFSLAHLQKESNRYESIIALHAMTSASDSLVIDDNTQVSNVTGRGDRIIHYRSIGPGSKEPHRLQHGSLDNGIYEQRQRIRDAFQNVSGAVNVWRGQQAGSVTAAAAISQLRGQAEQTFSKPTDNWRNLWVETVRKGVKMKQLLMQPWEIAEIMGKGHDVQIAKFKQADLDTIIDWVATSHGLPKTRDEKRNDMLALFDRGALDITDPNVKIRISELFGETGMEQMFNRDATRARSENDAMSQGGEPHFMPDVEDLQVHLYVHGEYIKRLDFDNLSAVTQENILKHYMDTKMALQQLMMMQANIAGGAGGATEGPGGSSSPFPPAGGEGGGGAPGGGPHAAGGPPNPNAPPHPKSKSSPKAKAKPGPRTAGTNKVAVPTGPNGPGSGGLS